MKSDKINLRFGALEFLMNFAYPMFFSYMVMYFRQYGHSESRIGIILSIATAGLMFSQIASGYLSDSRISVKKIVLFHMAASAVCAVLIIVFKNAAILAIFLYIVGSFTGRTLTSLLDSYVTKLSAKRSKLNFGVVRGFGSMGFAISAVLAGIIVNQLGFSLSFAIHAAAMAVGLLLCLKAEDVPVAHKSAGESVSFFKAASELLRHKPFMLALLASLVTYIGSTIHSGFLALVIVDVGGSSASLGIGLFLMAGSEAPVMWNYYRLMRRFTEEQLLMFSFIMYCVKIILIMLFYNVIGVVLLQAMQAITFALFLPSMIRYLGKIIPDRLLASSIMLWSSVYGGGSGIIASLIGGFVIEKYGIMVAHFVALAFCAVGAAIMAYKLITEGKSPHIANNRL